MNFWHMQLHPGDPNWKREVILKIVSEFQFIGLGDEWENDGGKPNLFQNKISIGDIILVRHGGPLCLVEVIGDCETNPNPDPLLLWFNLMRKIRVLSLDGEKFKNEYNADWKVGLYNPNTLASANNSPFIKFWYNKIIIEQKMKEFTELLESNKNLIFTGAPGTGKTYLAKEIAKAMTGSDANENNPQYGFVQFHPSYDYTDFVEGLRPIKEGNSLGFERRNGIFMSFCKEAEKFKDKKFVFLIDEINRGEISKIFGELFFSIDPGYRGEKGKVKTQYANLREEADQYFHVPENVYVIGTMNDIDRSVESMDFAMRRRFAWKEITAEESQRMFDSPDFIQELNEKIDIKKLKNRMNNLNNAIIDDKLGLSTAYQIGAAYFLKLVLYVKEDQVNAFKSLWDNHLKVLLSEYLRGTPKAGDKLNALEAAYNNEK